MNSLLLFFCCVQAIVFLASLFLGLTIKFSPGNSAIFGYWDDVTVGAILLAMAFLPSFLLLLLIDNVGEILSYQPFKDKK